MFEFDCRKLDDVSCTQADFVSGTPDVEKIKPGVHLAWVHFVQNGSVKYLLIKLLGSPEF